MKWHAIDRLRDSFDATRWLLFPFSLGRWVVLGIVVFFLSGTTGMNPGFNLGLPDVTADPAPAPPAWENGEVIEGPVVEGGLDATAIDPGQVVALLLIVGALIVVGLLVGYVASVMEFVFVRMAASGQVRLRDFLAEFPGKGLSLFAFRLVMGIAILGTVAFLAVGTAVSDGFFLVLLLLLSPLFVLVGVGLWLLLRFTDDFVVPVMIVENTGIVGGWRAFWPELRSEWKQYGLYAAVRFVLGVAAGVVVGVGTGAIAVALLVPFGIVGLFAYLLFGALGFETVAFVLGVGTGVLFVALLVAAVTVFVQVPVQTYLRYYPLFVLGDASPQFDMVKNVREAVAHGPSDGDRKLDEWTDVDEDSSQELSGEFDEGDDGGSTDENGEGEESTGEEGSTGENGEDGGSSPDNRSEEGSERTPDDESDEGSTDGSPDDDPDRE